MYVIGQEEVEAASAVIRSGQLFRYRGGEAGEVCHSERLMEEMLGCEYSLAVTSGTGALICGLVGLGIGPGDEVIVPAYTWLASAGAVLSVGAIPVLADVDESLTLDAEALERRIGPRTKAVIPVHMGGRPTDMDRIVAVARKHGLAVLEDACQSVGGSYKGRRLGTIGDAGVFSFNQFKILTCGEGGALLTSDRRVYERALYHHDMGCTFRAHVGEMSEAPLLGNTYRMNEILGAVLRVQLGRLDGLLGGLRSRHCRILEAVRAEASPLQITRSADQDGDCGLNATFSFASRQEREQVSVRAKEIDPVCKMLSPIDSGLHVYTNWAVLLDGKGACHDAVNPFLMPENKACRTSISASDCLKTLDILARTGTVEIQPTMTDAACDATAAALCQAAREILK